MRNLWKTISAFEFWPSYVFYAPFFFVWVYYCLRSRSILYFSVVNHHVAFGGLLRYSKYEMIKNLKKESVVFSKLYEEKPSDIFFYQSDFNFPFIIKPNAGERGKDVHLVRNIEQWQSIYQHINQSFILQEYNDSAIELGILYYRYPSGYSNISSIVIKEFLKVKGDGKKTLKSLVEENLRAKKRANYFQQKFATLWLTILPDGKELLLEEIGNHCRGTVFKDANHLINKKLVTVFDDIVRNDAHFHYGRFDLKVNSIEEMYEGKGIQIFELNGVNSEAAHIYQPGQSLLKAYRDVLFHYTVVYTISKELRSRGLKPKESIGEFYNAFKLHYS